MGKSLIIKGADFSANAIVSTYALAIDCNSDIENASTSTNVSAASFADTRYAQLYSKHLVGVEFKPSQAGTISILGNNSGVMTLKTTLTITQDMIGVKTFFPVSIDVGSSEMMCILNSEDTGGFYFYNSTHSDNSFIGQIPSQNVETNKGLGVNWYVETF